MVEKNTLCYFNTTPNNIETTISDVETTPNNIETTISDIETTVGHIETKIATQNPTTTIQETTTEPQKPTTTIQETTTEPQKPTTKSKSTTIELTTEQITTVKPTTIKSTTIELTTEKQKTTTIKPTTIVTTIRTTTKKRATSCSSGWTYLDKTGQCYKVIKTSENPLGCFQQFATEISIHSEEENELIGTLAQKQSILPFSNTKVRLGLVNSQWTDGTPLDYTKWAYGEPRKGNKCVQLESCFENSCWLKSNKNVWSTINCSSPAKYLVCTRSF